MRALLLLPVLLAACRSGEPAAAPAPAPAPAPAAAPERDPDAPVVVHIEHGRVTGKDHEGREPAEVFGPRDVFYVTVAARNVVRPTPVTTRWVFEGEPLYEESQELPPDGDAVVEFHIKKASGWAVGGYRLDVLVDGRLEGSRPFRVEAAP